MRNRRFGFLLSPVVILAMAFGWALDASAILMGGSIQGTALNLSPSSVSTLAGTAGVAGSADGIGSAASFTRPVGITTDGLNLYVTDKSNNTIRKIVIATGAVTTLAGTAGVSGSADGTGPAASFNRPVGITTDGTNLYVVDSSNCTIRKIVIATGYVSTLAGTALSCGNSATQFDNPIGITYNGTYLFVADSYNNSIRKVDKVSGAITAVTTTNRPYDLTANSEWLFTTDPGFNMIHEIFIANGIDYFPLSNIGLNYPEGITGDGTNMYISDTSNHRICKYSGGTCVTIAGATGISGSVDGTNALFNFPAGITTDGVNLYVCDRLNSTIRKIGLYTPPVTTYTVTTSAGTGGTISPSGPVTVNSGATTAFTVTPNSGYSIGSVTGCNGSISGNTYTTGAITAACTVSVTFTATAPTTYTVTTSAGTGGTISPSGPVTVNSGATTAFTVMPNSGYSISSVAGCSGHLSGNTYTTGAITSNCTVSASFMAAAPTTYTVSTSAGTGGSISPSSATVNSGITTAFTITANTGFTTSSVTGCGGTLSGSTYTTGPITVNCTVNAVFAVNTASNPVMTLPASKAVFSYQASEDAFQSDNSVNAKPIGVGKIASGGNKINIYIGLVQFSAPVDIYFAVSAPAIDPNNLYLLGPLHLFQPLSAGLTAWKYNTIGPVSESLFGEFPASSLPKGTYTLYLAVTPAGSTGSYYLWETDFTVK